MVQDRYALRSAPQWIGPQLEDLLLAHQQITTELNSSSDNPLTDVSSGDILYGCNFQASSVCSAMEKTRLCLQMFGRLLFSQLTELVDPHLSGGLPTNLAADDPSLSFTMKGVEISMAAYMAELSYFANPMSSHVQAAEMHNQSVNSMAFASARMTMQAIDILSLMCACSLYAGCQALDLRALHMSFKKKTVDVLSSVSADLLAQGAETEDSKASIRKIFQAHIDFWDSTGKLDIHDRCKHLVDSALPLVLTSFPDTPSSKLVEWQGKATEAIFKNWGQTFDEFCAKQHTPNMLGKGSAVLYHFVRETLRVPFHRGFVEHPTNKSAQLDGREKKTVGGWISVIYESIQNGAVYGPLMDLVAKDFTSTNGTATNGTASNGKH
jgi:phenylalanine ammonia-lyase